MMRTRSTRPIRLLASALLTLSLVGTAIGQSDALEFWLMPFTDQPEAKLAPFLERFEEETGIRVNLTVVPYGEALGRLQTAIASGRAPDLTYMTDGRFMPLVEFGNALEPLGPYMDEAFTSRYVDPAILEQYQVGGEYYTVPFGFVTYLWAINLDHFEDAGVDPELIDRMTDPEASWNWDDLEGLFAQLTRDTDDDGRIDRWAYAYPGASTWLHPFPLWLWNAGGRVFHDDGTLGLDPEPTARALEFLVGALEAEQMPPGSESMSPPDAIDAFATGRTSMINNVWPANGLFVWPEQFEDLDYELVYPPEGPTGARTTYYGSALLSIPTQSGNKEGAWQLIEFFLRPEFQEFVSGTGFFPVTGELSPEMEQNADVRKYYDVLPWSIPEPRHPNTGIVQQIYNSQTQSALTGQQTPAEAAESMRRQAQDRIGN